MSSIAESKKAVDAFDIGTFKLSAKFPDEP